MEKEKGLFKQYEDEYFKQINLMTIKVETLENINTIDSLNALK